MALITLQNSRQIQTAPSTTLVAAQSFKQSYLTDFVAYLDRSEGTSRTHIINLRQFACFMNFNGIVNPTRQDIINYRDWLSSEHIAIELSESVQGWQYRLDSTGHTFMVTCKPATIRLYLQSVKQLFGYLSSNGLYPNVASQIHGPKVQSNIHKKDALTPSEVLDIEHGIVDKATQKTEAQAHCAKDTQGRIQRSTEQGKRMYAMYLLAVNAGLRTIEISRANVRDIECKGNQAYIYIWGKGHSEADQKKPIAIEVYKAVKDYIDSRTDNPSANSPLFVSTGNRSFGKRIATTTISKMLKKAMVQAGYDSERLTAHSLRHTTGTCVQELTGNLYSTQQYMRHSNPATTEIYLHNESEKQDANIANQLYDFYHNTPSSPSQPQSNILDGLTTSQLDDVMAYIQKIKSERA